MAIKHSKANPVGDLLLELDATFFATVSSAMEIKEMAGRLKRDELPLEVELTYGANTIMLQVYPDTPGCTLSFTGPDKGRLKCTIRGRLPISAKDYELKPKDLAALTDPPAEVKASILDSNYDRLPIDDGEDGLVTIGRVAAPSTAAAAPSSTSAKAASKAKVSEAAISASVSAAITLVLGGSKAAKAEITKVRKAGGEPDYVLEAHLEALVEALAGSAESVQTYLATIGSDMDALGVALRSPWLDTDLVGWELRVRAAEALGAWSAATGESLDVVTKRLGSKDPCERMWAARAIRAINPKSAAALLKKLAKDPFEDDNGFYLVREAAGFHEE